MNLFDLSKFEKTAEDKHSTTMRHSDGHEIRIVHSSLPKLKREQLKRLKLAKGGDVERLDAGGDVSSNDTNGSEASDGGSPTQTSSPAAGTTINIQAGGSPQQAAPASPAPIIQTPDVAEMKNPVEAANAAAPDQPTNIPQVPANSITSPLGPNGQLDPAKQAQMLQQSSELQRNVDVEKGRQAANIQAGYNAAQQEQLQNIQNNLNAKAQQTRAIADYTLSDRNQVNPNSYLEHRGVGQKIANAFGLLAGGLKQGLIGGDNPAMTFINNQIQRDIDAQKNRQEQAKTVYGYFKDLYGEGNQTNALTQVAMNNIYEGKFKKMAAELGTPQAYAAQQAFSAQKGAENQGLLKSTAVPVNQLPGYNQSSGSAGQQGPPSARPNSAGATGSWDGSQQNNENSIVSPGANSAYKTIAVPADKEKYEAELTAAQQAEKNLKKLDEHFDDAYKNATYSGNISEHINPHALGAVGAVGGGIAGGLAGAAGGPLAALTVPGGATAGASAGATAGEGLGHAAQGVLGASGGQKQVRFEQSTKQIEKTVAAALSGTKLTPTEIHEAIGKFLPSIWDSEETKEFKKRGLKELVKQNLETKMLQRYGALK